MTVKDIVGEGMLVHEKIPDKELNERIAIKGEIPSPVNPKDCCRFVERCPHAMECCREHMPEAKEVEKGHVVACHLYD